MQKNHKSGVTVSFLLAMVLLVTPVLVMGAFENVELEPINFGSKVIGADAADIDGDGDLDFLSYQSYFSHLHLTVNNGSGLATHYITNNANDGKFIDVDGDGDVDIANVFNYGGVGQHGIQIRLNNGSGSFAHSSTMSNTDLSTSLSNIASMAVGDFDDDGDEDIVVAGNRWSQRLTVLANDGAGNFTEHFNGTWGNGQTNDATEVQFADFDGDGLLDIFLTAQTWGNGPLPMVWENTGSGFTPAFSEAAGAATFLWTADASIADMDNDGDLDIVAQAQGAMGTSMQAVVIYENTGFFSFTGHVIYDHTGQSAGGVRAADMDYDGDMDLVTTTGLHWGGTDNQRLMIMENQGGLNFVSGFEGSQATGTLATIINSISWVGDAEGDGDNEVLTGEYYAGFLWGFNSPPPVPDHYFLDPLAGPASPDLQSIDADYTYTTNGLYRSQSDYGWDGWIPGVNDRPMVKTGYADYLNTEFRAEVTVAVTNSNQVKDLIYFGFGAGDNNPGYDNEPTNSFYFRIHNSSGYKGVQAVFHEGNGGPSWNSTNLVNLGDFNPSGTTFRIDRVGSDVTLSIVGGASATFPVSAVSTINSSNSHVFFGNSAVGTTISNLSVQPPPQQATAFDVWDTSDPNNYVLIGHIDPIVTAESGSDHYDYYSASAHPTGVNLGANTSNLWMHENSNDGDLTFGFVFGADASGAPGNYSSINFRIVGSDTDPTVTQSDDPNEAVETPAGSDAFIGNFGYGNNTDGIAVSGISGDAWTIIVQSVDFGSVITEWFAANGLDPGFSDDLPLTLGNEYRITPAGNPPSGAPVVVTNTAPTANAGDDKTIDCVVNSADVTLSGSGSDDDGDALTYSWSDGSSVVSTDASFTTSLGGGTHTFTLTVSDGEAEATDDVSVTVNVDETAPAIADLADLTAENDPGECGAEVSFSIDASDACGVTSLVATPASGSVFPVGNTTVTVTASDAAGNTSTSAFTVTVEDTEAPVIADNEDMTISNDPGECGALVIFNDTAEDNCGDVDVVAVPASGSFFEVGTTTVTLTATDAAGNESTSSFDVTVEDNEAPNFVVSAEPETMWPPNHKYRTFDISDFVVTVEDNCAELSLADIVITSVTSDEEENARGRGDGNTNNDMVINNGSVDLRAERQGGGNGRVYTVHLAVADGNGNSSASSFQVHVPHSRNSTAIDDGVAYTVTGSALAKFAGRGDEITIIPSDYALSQNYPNPFNPSTTISYAIPRDAVVSLRVFDMRGSLVSELASGYQLAGQYQVDFQASDLSSGTYIYVLEAGSFREVKRMAYLK